MKRSRFRGYHSVLRVATFAALVAFLTTSVCGCAVYETPIHGTPPVVPSPVKGRVTVAARKDKPVGGVVPVYISVSNGTDVGRKIDPSQVFALTPSDERVAPLPLAEAIRRAGGAAELHGALKSAAVGGIATAAVGAVLGALLVGLSGGSAGEGAAVGAGAGLATGALVSASNASAEAKKAAHEQMTSLALHTKDVRHNYTASGYVFYPKGNYKKVEAIVTNTETGETQELTTGWQ